MQGMFAAAETFMRMGEQLFKAVQGIGEGVQSGNEWTAMLGQTIGQAKKMFQSPGADSFDWQNMAAWNQPLQGWNKMMSENPLLKSLLGSSGLSGMAGVEQWLAVPGLGVTREKQERLKVAVRDGLVFQKAFAEFQNLLNSVNVRALDLLHKKLLELGASRKTITSLHDLYVLWVDCNEEANKEVVSGEEYQKLNAHMVNAMIRVQSHLQTMVDDNLDAMNLPTRRELDSSHRKVQILKKRLRAMEAEIALLRSRDPASELSALRDDMERLDVKQLRRDVGQLKQQLAEKADPPPQKKVAAPVARRPARAKTSVKTAAVTAKGDATAKGE